jgi:CubicO group peptidase (beta-lactamase class C family)
VEEFLRVPVDLPPGGAFTYSSATSHMLSAITQMAAGESVLDYLQPRLFEPLGFSGHSWDTDPEGICSGGNGLSLRSVDLLKWGALHLQDGMWAGARILPDGWVEAATRRHVAHATPGAWNGTEYVPSESVNGLLDEGYGYQIWVDARGSYRASGMFGQDVFVFPDHDAVVAITGSVRNSDHPLLVRLLHDELVPAFTGTPSPTADRQLHTELAGTHDAPALPTMTPALDIDGMRFRCEPNADGLDAIRFRGDAETLVVTLTDTRGAHDVRCGLATWMESRTGVTGWQLHHSYQPPSMRILAAARWTTPRRLVLEWYFVESPFHDVVSIDFVSGSELRLHRRTNVNSGATERPVITARLV